MRSIKKDNKLEPIISETVSTDKNLQQMPAEFVSWLKRELEREGLPLTAITILGGKPYLNNLGVLWKFNEILPAIQKVEYIWLQEPGKENDFLGGVKCRIYLKEPEEKLRLRAVIVEKAIESGKSPKEIDEILETSGLSPSYVEDEGWLSAYDSAISWDYEYDPKVGKKVKTRLKLGNLRMHLLTKAFDRAARKLIRTAFGLLEESGETIEPEPPNPTDLFTPVEVTKEKEATDK